MRSSHIFAMASVCAAFLAAACGDDEGGTTVTTVGAASSSSTGLGSTNASSSSTGSGVSSSSGGPVTCMGDYTDVPTGECDLLGDDCSEGSWCNVTGSGDSITTSCIANGGGLKDTGAECATSQECKPGNNCQLGHCTPFCCPDTNEPCAGGDCNVNLSYGDSNFAFVCSYSASCTLFAGDCPEGEHCHIDDPDAGLAVCDLPSSNLTTEGMPCQFRNDCPDSHICQEDVCRSLCDSANWESLDEGKGGCPSGRECSMVNAGAFMNLGICLPPS